MSDKKLNLETSVTLDELLVKTAARITENSNVAIAGSAATISVDGKTLEQSLPEGLSLEQYIQAQQLNHLLINACSLSMTDQALPILANNPDVKTIELNMPTIGKSSFEGSIQRDYMRPNAGGGDQIPAIGKMIAVAHNDYSSRGTGELRNIKARWSELVKNNLAD